MAPAAVLVVSSNAAFVARCLSDLGAEGFAASVATGLPVAGSARPGPADVDLVDYLLAGADDALLHPERTRELVARVRAVLRAAVRPCELRDP